MNILISKLRNSKFIKNTGWLVVAQIYQMLVSLVIGVICARYLGPNNYGILSYGSSYIAIFTIISSLGLEGIIVKEIVTKRDKEGIILGTSIIMRLICGLISVVFVIVLVYFLNPDNSLLYAVVFLQSLILLFSSFSILECWYQSYLNSKIVTIVKCIAYTFMTGYKILILLLNCDVVWFAFSTSLDSVIIAVLFYWFYNRDCNYKLEYRFDTAKSLFKQSYHLVIAYLMVVLYTQMDKIMIGKILGQEEVGYYSAAVTICNMWVFIPQAFTNSARPLIVESYKDKETYLKRLKMLSSFIFWLGIIVSIFIFITSEYLICILYGDKYMQASAPLVLIIWSTIFSSLSYPRSIWMICEEKQQYTKHIVAAGVIVNWFFNYILINLYGIIGAAISTLCTEFITCFIVPYIIKDTRAFVYLLINSINTYNIKYVIRLIKNKDR